MFDPPYLEELLWKCLVRIVNVICQCQEKIYPYLCLRPDGKHRSEPHHWLIFSIHFHWTNPLHHLVPYTPLIESVWCLQGPLQILSPKWSIVLSINWRPKIPKCSYDFNKIINTYSNVRYVISFWNIQIFLTTM